MFIAAGLKNNQNSPHQNISKMNDTILYSTASGMVSLFGYTSSILILILIVAIVYTILIGKKYCLLVIVSTVFIILPGLTPIGALIFGYEYFTMLNYSIQEDENLKCSAVLLISMFGMFFLFGVKFSDKDFAIPRRQKLIFDKKTILIVFSLNFVLMLTFIESGSIIFNEYKFIKLDNPSPFSSTVNQFFNLCVSLMLTYIAGEQRKRVLVVIYIFFIILALVMSRRTLAVGLLILYSYSFFDKMNSKQVAVLFFGALALLLVGEVRSTGLTNYFDYSEDVASQKFFSLPGGASNVFVGTMGVIDMFRQGALNFPETFPILLWPFGIFESSIYSEQQYDYNGGMHIANVFYWNFGLIGVFFGGVFLGVLTSRVHYIASRYPAGGGADLPSMMSCAYVIVLANTIWYSPIGLIKLSCAVFVAYQLLRCVHVMRWK